MKKEVTLPIELVIFVLDKLRYYSILLNWDGPEKVANLLQFGLVEECRICEKVVDCNHIHRCWNEKLK